MRIFYTFGGSFLFFAAINASAHPVVYKDGIVTWVTLSNDSNISRVSYSLSSKFGLEINSSYYKAIDSYRDYTFGLNYLFTRWIGKNSQANLYGQIHGGYYKRKKLDLSGAVGHTSLIADWESRKWYTAASATAMYLDNEIWQKYNYRIGFAPYVAGMDALQTWMILQLSYFKESKDQIVVTPMMRFFYKNALWEIGSSTRGNFFLSLMTHM